MTTKPVIVFDLDHTLIHSDPVRRHGFDTALLRIGRERLFVHLRPGAPDLIRYLCRQKKMRFGFWTAGTMEYAQAVVEVLFRAAHVSNWRSQICTLLSRKSAVPLNDGTFLKQLTVVSKSLEVPHSCVWLVDDDLVHTTAPCNRGRILQAPAFVARSTTRGDAFLPYLQGSLKHLCHRSIHASF
jgi:hypothetical protein